MGFAAEFNRLTEEKLGRERRSLNNLEELAMQERRSGFLPDKGAFEADLAASLEGIKADLPYDLEAYRATQASRGIFSGGEATKFEYRDVIAPIARELAQATSQSKLAYSKQFQTGRIAEENLRATYVQTLMSYILGNKKIEADLQAAKAQAKGNATSDIFSAAGTYFGAKA